MARARRDAHRFAAQTRHRRLSLGRGCDLRSGLHFVAAGDGEARFGTDCVLDRHMTIQVLGQLIVGARTIFGHSCTIAANDYVEIGSNCLIAEMVSIRDHDHAFARIDVPVRDQGYISEPVVIEDDVWLGTRVVVAKGVRIGRGAVVGAGAVVTRDLPAFSIAAGVPARVIGDRRDAQPRPATS